MKLYFKNEDFELKLEGTVEELEQFDKTFDMELIDCEEARPETRRDTCKKYRLRKTKKED